jgi:DNA (cytosine-5)-methyltransferase 1
VENVAALRNRGLDTVLGDLAASGYDAEWDCLPASCVGAPHLRDRLFVVAYPHRDQRRMEQKSEQARSLATDPRHDRPARPLADTHQQGELQPLRSLEESRGRPRNRGPPLADAHRVRLERRLFDRNDAREWTARTGRLPHTRNWQPEPRVGRVAHGIPRRVDRLRCLGNSVVPQLAEWIGKRIIEHEQLRRTSTPER